ncbi:alpha/beta fold hydrolase [Stackebrandtia nassauensis]|uniref:Alpha/beta hydrolase fold protein n=1 Tax=Stackebrandtia nassauensis (strain DSM 44728 / CIP 108903 / NRRL B-16338 / NBRC 102104 / LLR-40K-21) TaxID=446470 RepID=D3PWS8_STANL|nr:alpha/beta fold hydrolase [Stackebrandtia nassauensis]ADD43300.1 alpha/beta hydrolase fold protein [Stackebrandtia nassauensis DSM 44728]
MSATFHIPGLILTEHEFQVPLDHSRPDGQRITVFAREVADPKGRDRPFLVFLQGGPGQEAPRPHGVPYQPGWLDRALADYRVLMLDQRGTGRSTPVGDLAGMTPQEQADYLTHFRADAIVRDAEWIRAALGVDSWSVLGQSFGGFCCLNYLSQAPEGLREVFFTGGVPPVGRHPDDVYRNTYVTMRERNRRYYQRYPGDRDRVAAIVDRLEAGDLRLPDGDVLTARRFRQIGNMLGMSDGAERLHYIVERDPDSPAFRHDVAAAMPFSGRNPLYAVIHESSYADGHATRWSAQRTLPADFESDQTLFTGEHVYSWMFTDYRELAPLREAAEILAEHEWPVLYDAERLRACEVPCAAAIYAEDAYVDRVYSEETAALIPTMRSWLTNEFEHNGLRAAGDRVLDRLIALTNGYA